MIESKYTLSMGTDGFTISAPDRATTYVRTNGYGFDVSWSPADEYYVYSYGLYDLRRIIEGCAAKLMRDWKPPERGKKIPWIIAKWAKTQTAKALAKRIKAAWLEILARLDPTVLAVQRKCFSVCGKSCHNVMKPELYTEENKFLIKDILNYRAAALAVADMQVYPNRKVCWRHSFYRMRDTPTWMGVYTYGDEPNKSLRKTLMNLPGGVPYGLLEKLAYRELSRPIYTRLELLAYTNELDYQALHVDRNLAILERSNAKQIRRALSLVAKHLREKDTTRKTVMVLRKLRYIFDYPENHNGSIVGMAEKSIRWHREGHYARERSYVTGVNPATEVKAPAIELPKVEGIRFLRTVGDYISEGSNMDHCVASYARQALAGGCFIFHVDYHNETSTVEISPDGYVRQARGPHNTDNKACHYAKRVLGKWAKGLRSPDEQESKINEEVVLQDNRMYEYADDLPF